MLHAGVRLSGALLETLRQLHADLHGPEVAAEAIRLFLSKGTPEGASAFPHVLMRLNRSDTQQSTLTDDEVALCASIWVR